MNNVDQVSLGGWHSACIAGSDFYLWGFNGTDQIGDIYYYGPKVCYPILIMRSVIQVSLGKSNTACIDSNGIVYIWGYNNCGQLGIGSDYITSCFRNPILDPEPLFGDVVQVSIGFYHSACLTVNGDLYIWGNDANGELGDGASENKNTPQKIMSNVELIAMGNGFSACETKDGEVYFWGNNSCGQLGNGTTEKSSVPQSIEVRHDHNIEEAYSCNETGHWHSCSGCAEQSGYEAHTKDDGIFIMEEDLTGKGTVSYSCTVCGYSLVKEAVPAVVSSFEVTSDNVIMYYTITGSTAVKSQTYAFSDVTEEMLELMKSKNIQLVIDFVNYSAAGAGDTFVLTAAQMKAVEYVLEYDLKASA